MENKGTIPAINQSELPVMEAFYTIQGEGYHQGKAAYFIRLGGCDVGCVWCDVKESWNADNHPRLSIKQITRDLLNTPAPIAVITGGEPFMHHLGMLTTALQEQNIRTHIETSGSYPVTGTWNWICVSPKKFKAPLPEVLARADELKVVIYHPSDFKWAEQHAASVSQHCKLYLQPEWSKAQQVTPLIVEYIKQHPRWELSLQVHKYINVP